MIKLEKHWNRQKEDGISSHFPVHEAITHDIWAQLSSIIEPNILKTLTPRDIYHEPFDVLLTTQQKLYLMDNWLIDCNPATKEEAVVVEDWNYNQIDSWLEYSTFVSQDWYKIEQDIPLVSDGFSKCHAVVIYNPWTCATMMLHVVDFRFEQQHMEAIKKFLNTTSWWEAIFVYGSESRYRPAQDHAFLNTLWCSSKNITVSTWPYHRWILYEPKTNKIMIQRATSSVAKEMVVFGWFSEKTYNKEKRASYDIDNRKKRLELEVLRQILIDNHHYTMGWIVSSQQFKKIVSLMQKKIWASVDAEQLITHALFENKLMIRNDMFVFPWWFMYDNDNPPIRERFPDAFLWFSLKFYAWNTTNNFYTHVMAFLSKHWYAYVEGNRSNVLLSNTLWWKIIIDNALDAARFYFIWDRSLQQKRAVLDLTRQFAEQSEYWFHRIVYHDDE